MSYKLTRLKSLKVSRVVSSYTRYVNCRPRGRSFQIHLDTAKTSCCTNWHKKLCVRPLENLWTEPTEGLAKAKPCLHGYVQAPWKAHKNSSINLRGSPLIGEVYKLLIIQANRVLNKLTLVQTNSLSN